MEKIIKHDVIVHKAGLALLDGESLGKYSSELSKAGRTHIMKKLNLTGQTASVYMVEAYNDMAVFDVYKRGPSPDSSGEYKYYAVKYSRGDKGAFDFSETVEVQRVTSFAPVTKEAGEAAEAEATPSPNENEVKPGSGWESVAKAIWEGVL